MRITIEYMDPLPQSVIPTKWYKIKKTDYWVVLQKDNVPTQVIGNDIFQVQLDEYLSENEFEVSIVATALEQVLGFVDEQQIARLLIILSKQTIPVEVDIKPYQRFMFRMGVAAQLH